MSPGLMDELILADNHLCACLENSEGHPQFVMGETRMFEVLALCLEVWVALKRFQKLKRPPTDYITRDSFAVSLKMSVLYFAV